MRELRFTLVSDGPSDSILVPILRWILVELCGDVAIHPAWAELRTLPRPPRALVERLAYAVQLYPCDLLFVHRDAEAASPTERAAEIQVAIEAVQPDQANMPTHVPVIPVRMTEAWLLFSEELIRQAAGNPRGKVQLNLPTRGWDEIGDPKTMLYEALQTASGLNNRRRATFNPRKAAYRIAELADDFAALRSLRAFHEVEERTRSAIRALGY